MIEWGVAAQTSIGQSESGDMYLVEPFPGGVLVAVVDGLGHGPKAAEAARAAIAALKGYAHEPVDELLRRCHEELLGTRGVVMSLASFHGDGTMTWVGVGNVHGLFFRAKAGAARPREALLPRGGVVGYRLPSLYPVTISVGRDDALIFATDGLRSSFAQDVTLAGSPQGIADRILARYSKRTDDALVSVVRYVAREGG